MKRLTKQEITPMVAAEAISKEVEQYAKWQDKKIYSELVDLLERLRTIYRNGCDSDIKYNNKRLQYIQQFKQEQNEVGNINEKA
jgi:hypothetical protein